MLPGCFSTSHNPIFFVYRMIYLLMILFCRWEIINVVLSLLITIFILNFMLQVLTRPPLQMRTTKCLPGLTIVTISTWLFSNPSQSHYIIVLAFTFHCRFDWVFVMNLLSKNWTSNPLMFLQVQNAMVWRFNFVNRKVLRLINFLAFENSILTSQSLLSYVNLQNISPYLERFSDL